MLLTNSLTCLPEGYILLGKEFWVDCVFLSGLEKSLPPPSTVLQVSEEKSAVV